MDANPVNFPQAARPETPEHPMRLVVADVLSKLHQDPARYKILGRLRLCQAHARC
jgi:hypothetical protein